MCFCATFLDFPVLGETGSGVIGASSSVASASGLMSSVLLAFLRAEGIPHNTLGMHSRLLKGFIPIFHKRFAIFEEQTAILELENFFFIKFWIHTFGAFSQGW